MDFFGIFSCVGCLPTWCWIVALLVALIYMYGKQPLSTFTKLGIPGPKPVMFLGNLRQISQKGITEQIGLWRKEYGNVFGMFLGMKPQLVVSDLDMLKEILVKDFQHFTDRFIMMSNKAVLYGVFFQQGHNWKRIRSIISPTFSSGKIKVMYPSVINCGKMLANNMEIQANKGETVDVKNSYGAYTMDVIARTAFGLDIDSQTNPDEPFVHFARQMFIPKPIKFVAFMALCIFRPSIHLIRLLDIGIFPNGAVSFFVKVIRQMIEERKDEELTANTKRSDFLQLLINAENEEGNGKTQDEQSKTVKRLSPDEIIGQALLFFIAGYETTSTTLQYTTYILATHPDVQDKLIEEINTKIGDREATYEDLIQLTYMEQVIQETLRMFPPIPNISRVASQEVTIRGVTIPKDCVIAIPVYHIHHDPEVYENPEEFIPERFADKNLNPVAFLPFGYGPKLCIGLRLAMMEAKVALVCALQKIRFVKHEKTAKKMELHSPGGILTPKVPIIVGVELINQS